MMTINNDNPSVETPEESPLEDSPLEERSLKPTKHTWLYIYGAIATVGMICLIFIGIYRQMPKKSAPVKKRVIPATQSVFTMVLSPLDRTTADAIADDIDRDIGKDSTVTQMIVGGTAVHKRCVSLDDFSMLSRRAMVEAQPEQLKRQAVLLSYVAGVIISDALPTRLYIVGKLDESDYNAVDKRISGVASAIGDWNRAFRSIKIITYLPTTTTSRGDSVQKAFITALRKQSSTLEERAIPLVPTRQ